MRTRVMAAIDELGYEPDFLAQSLRGGFTRMVGFVLRDLSNPIFADIVKGAEMTLREAGLATLLANSEGDPSLDVRNITILDRRRVDGILLSLQSETTDELPEILSALEVPIVLIDREVEGVVASAVICGHRAGVADATNHLLDLGHRKIAFISGPTDIRATRERLGGFRDALADRGVGIEDDFIRTGPYSSEFGRTEVIELMSRPDRPSALLAGSVQLTTGILQGCSELGLKLGSDYALVSCDESELMRFVDPPLSVIRRDALLLGQIAGEMMLELVAGDADPRQVEVPTEYIARESSSPPASA